MTKAIKSFLDAHPEVESVRWQMWIPGFNDGDPCEFTVGDPRVRLYERLEADEELEDDEDLDEEWQEAWDLGYDSKQAGKPEPKELIKGMGQLSELFGEAEDALRATFGVNVQVTVGRDGEAQVEEYDCGH